MKVLIVYEMLPEEVKVVVVEMSEDEYAFFSKANGFTINRGKMPEESYQAIMAIDGATYSSGESELGKKYFEKWKHLDAEVDDISDVDKIIRCGFAC